MEAPSADDDDNVDGGGGGSDGDHRPLPLMVASAQ